MLLKNNRQKKLSRYSSISFPVGLCNWMLDIGRGLAEVNSNLHLKGNRRWLDDVTQRGGSGVGILNSFI